MVLRNVLFLKLKYIKISPSSSVRFSRQKRLFTSCQKILFPLDIQPHQDVFKIRNIGIIAHIDAGKTTTTERMLYYSGYSNRIGDVDTGSTITDFLPAERARGITIQSAAVTFHWPPQSNSEININQKDNAENFRSSISHQINLIDTPGHADFTFEVRRSLRVLDGAVCILDGVAGVEAQTEQVWSQAGEWNIPRIIYINKLDRDGAGFGRTIREIGIRLSAWPAVCQIPWYKGGKGQFQGIANVINLEGLLYDQGDGKSINIFDLSKLDKVEPELAQELRRARIALVELLSEHDDNLVEAFLEANEDHMAVSPRTITQSLRKCLLKNTSPIIPIFAGASFRNIGVQPLLDAINDLLPSPKERPDPEVKLDQISGTLSNLIKGNFMTVKGKKQTALIDISSILKACALAFKVVTDPRKGVLVYIRVYHGSIHRNDLLFNTNLQVAERATNLLRMYASDSIPIQSIEAGQIGVIANSKFARTGDTLISYHGNKSTPPEPLNKLFLRPIIIPPPVFFASMEPNSLREEKDMHEKLALLLREDPSLKVHQDEDTGQTLLSGMGELHLEIARDRLVNDFKAKANMGKIAIGYRETLIQSSEPITKIFDKDGKAGCTVTVAPLNEFDVEDDFIQQDGNVVVLKSSSLDQNQSISDTISLPNHLNLQEIQQAYISGTLAALSRGPNYSYPMHNVKVTILLDLKSHIFGNETTYSTLTSAAKLATIAAFRSTGKTAVMEPVMNVDIKVDEASLGNIVQDISSNRGGQIISLGDDIESNTKNDLGINIQKIYAPKDPFEFDGFVKNNSQNINIQRTIHAKIPLKEMVGYLKHLRSMTGGRGTFVMNVNKFERVKGQREKTLIAELRGD